LSRLREEAKCALGRTLVFNLRQRRDLLAVKVCLIGMRAIFAACLVGVASALLGPSLGRFQTPFVSAPVRKQTALSAAWWEDDLPNLFGINPIEASILLGALYYFYGSEVLYDYAREAGRLFSTYAPIVKDVSLDIFTEFRDYLEEDRERAALRKSGVDIGSMPRRTTNIIEKFQETLKTFSPDDKSSSDAKELLTAYGGGPQAQKSEGTIADLAPDATSASRISIAGKKSKREVLEERNVDVARVMEATDAVTRGGDDRATASLTESITAVREGFDALGEKGRQSAAALDSASADAGAGAGAGVLAPDTVGAASSSLGMSKFQQQMSGEWNNRVLRRDKWGSSSEGVSPGMSSSDETPPSFDYDFPQLPSELPNGFADDDDYSDDYSDDLTDSFVQRWERRDAPPAPVSSSMPLEIEMSPLPLNLPQTSPTLQVLQELDKDYLQLRQRLVDLLQSQQLAVASGVSTQAAGTEGEEEVEEEMKGPPGPGSVKYWPPLARQRR